ncbi:MAG: tetratricopeptide repeat protein [Acidobacteriota bacterium]
MRIIHLAALLTAVLFCAVPAASQEEARALWQVTNFDVTANVQPAERTLNAIAILTARNVGKGMGSSFTFRLNSKATVKQVTVGGTNANFRTAAEAHGNLQRVTAMLPGSIASNGSLTVTITYSLPVESNTGLAAIGATGTQFLPSSSWYPLPNTPLTVRGADTAPFRLTVNTANVISSGVEKGGGASSNLFEQSLNAQPFFVQGDWERIDGTGEGKSIAALVPKGAGADERRQAEVLIGLTASARSFYKSLLGPIADVPIRLVAVRRGSGFSDGGAVLIEAAAFRRSKIDSTTALLISEAIARLWIGGQTAVRGEASGVIREGLVRFLATSFIEKQFGKDAANAEILRERLAYSSIARRDGPLSRSSPLDDTYFNAVPNKGAMVWRLIDRRLGREAFMSTLRDALLAGKDHVNGVGLASLRAALLQKAGDSIVPLLDRQFDQVTDTDLMIGMPQLRGGEWVSALRNDGSTDALVTATAITDRGEQVSVEVTVPARNFSEAVFKTSGKLVRAEIDPEKFYPQVDYANDAAPRTRAIGDAIAEATRQLGAQDYVKAEAVAREVLATAPRMQEARITLARALLAQNKIAEAEQIFRAALNEALPTSSTLAWAAVGLGEIQLKKGQTAEAVKRFTEAVRAEGEYASSLSARASRINAEAGTTATAIDESARTFIRQLDQAIVSGKKAELDSRIGSGELVRFVGGIIGSQPEIWQTRVLRTEALDANLMAVDVSVNAKELGQERSGTAVLILDRSSGGWKLTGIELFEVR